MGESVFVHEKKSRATAQNEDWGSGKIQKSSRSDLREK